MAANDTFTAEVPREIEESPAFIRWEESADGSHFQKIEAAKQKIKSEGVVTSTKDLSNGLYEKKWHSGLRLYFAVIEKGGRKTLLLLGSGKGNEQDTAIRTAREILKNYSVIKSNIAKSD